MVGTTFDRYVPCHFLKRPSAHEIGAMLYRSRSPVHRHYPAPHRRPRAVRNYPCQKGFWYRQCYPMSHHASPTTLQRPRTPSWGATAATPSRTYSDFPTSEFTTSLAFRPPRPFISGAQRQAVPHCSRWPTVRIL